VTAEGAAIGSVWIVSENDYEAEGILGVFATETEARAFEVDEPTVVVEYRIGWRYNEDDDL